MTTHYLDPSDVLNSFDIGLVASLVTQGFELIAIDKTNRKKARFVLKRKDGIDEAARRYWDCCSQVDAQTFFNNLKMLKNRLYSD